MGLFSSEPKISKRELDEARSTLLRKGFSDADVDAVMMTFRGDIEEVDVGITKQELERGLKWLRDNKSRHSLSDSQIDTLKEVLESKL
ncbi:MAG: hypothetical protein O2794_00505 [bacterium]|nr:hypothetical protein [bacterium]